MIIEIASFTLKPDQIATFQKAFRDVTHLLSRAKGYVGHLLTQGIETPTHFTLIVQWRTLEDHIHGFEPSKDHQVFIACLQEYFAEEPSVYHVRATLTNGPIDVPAR